MIADARAIGEIPVSKYVSLEALARVGFEFTIFLDCLIAAALPLMSALWLFNRKAY